MADTGGVPLTGFKLYYFLQATSPPVSFDKSAATLAWNGADRPEVTEFTVSGLTLDRDYSFIVTALNPDEGLQSDALTVRAAGFPDAPASITEVAGTRTGQSIGLTWPAPAETGGSAVLAYTLAIFRENENYEIVYYGSVTSATVDELTSGETYHFMVKATTAVGDSPWSSNQFKFLIVDEPSPPLALELMSFDAT